MTTELLTDLLTNCEGFFRCFGLYLNRATEGLFWSGALLSFCVVLFIATSHFGRSIAFAFSGFVAIVGGIFLAILGFLDWGIASAFILIGAISLVVIIIKEK